MGLGLLLTVGSTAIISTLAEEILKKKGRIDVADNVSVATKGILATTAGVCLIKLILELRKLG